MEIGLWKDKYLIQFGEYQLDDKRDDDVVRRYNIWVSGSNTIFLVNCELLFNTIFDHNEIYEINMAMTNKNQRLSNGITTIGNQTLNNNFESY
jgi:hypothetical protein